MTVIESTRVRLKQRIADVLAEDLIAVREELSRQFCSPSMFVRDVAEHVGRFQGKQIRPILLLLSSRISGIAGGHRRQAAMLAAVVEMIHAATLVHDDVIDDADLRRHVSTVHRRWNTETSVLFGDYLFSRAFHLAATTGDAEACRLIGRATNRTCEGELNQIGARLEQSLSERDYFRVVYGKTAQLFAVSCRLGARVGGASESLQSQLSQFGSRLGIAFQIADDVLDLTETAESTGKDSANDLANQRMTLPVLRALRLASADDRERIRGLLFSADPADQQVLRESGLLQQGIESARQSCERFAERAVRCLRGFPDSEERLLLELVATYSAHRSE
jgi:octaprenyl-diphosphate synthase